MRLKIRIWLYHKIGWIQYYPGFGWTTIYFVKAWQHLYNNKEDMTITEDQTIWYPGIYNGQEGVYATLIDALDVEEIILIVQKRAQEDGEWAITNGHVGDNEDKMRKMMAWVSNPDNIKQCVEAALKDYPPRTKTVDFICRDLANGSKWVGGS
jgi:hypothetical protein